MFVVSYRILSQANKPQTNGEPMSIPSLNWINIIIQFILK